MRDLIAETLSADTILAGLLPGGVQTGRELTSRTHPDAFDANQEVLACALVKGTSDIGDDSAMRTSAQIVTIYLYDAPDAARQRIYTLLHNKKYSGGGRVEHLNDILDGEDGVLECLMVISRYGRSARRT